MNFSGKEFLTRLKKAELWGEKAHSEYSPPYRPVFSYDEILAKNPLWAAVNILLYFKNGEWFFPLMLRTENENDKHSGQISLPGGRRELGDLDFSQTAIRETSEEIGIDKNHIRLIRGLSPIYIPPSNFYVFPFVSFTKKNPEFYLQKSEAVELIEFPLRKLTTLPKPPETEILPTTNGYPVPIMSIDGHKIWGATSMILNEFSHLLKNL